MAYYGPTKNFQVPKPEIATKNQPSDVESKAPRRASMATQPMPRRRERFRSRFQRIHSDRRGLGRSPDGNLHWIGLRENLQETMVFSFYHQI